MAKVKAEDQDKQPTLEAAPAAAAAAKAAAKAAAAKAAKHHRARHGKTGGRLLAELLDLRVLVDDARVRRRRLGGRHRRHADRGRPELGQRGHAGRGGCRAWAARARRRAGSTARRPRG